MDLSKLQPYVRNGESKRLSFDIVGTGRPRTGTDGWEYRYNGHLTRHWPNGVKQRPALVDSVIIRAKPHGEATPVGSVYPFIAVKQ